MLFWQKQPHMWGNFENFAWIQNSKTFEKWAAERKKTFGYQNKVQFWRLSRSQATFVEQQIYYVLVAFEREH